MTSLFAKLALVALALFLWFWTQKKVSRKSGGHRLGDGVHRQTARMLRYFHRHPKIADYTLVVSSLFIDGVGITLFVLALFGSTFAPFIGLVIVFALRQTFQFCYSLPPPRGMIWRDPGFPSVLVTYGVTNDLFFSGHTALAVLGAIEIWNVAPGWIGGLAILIAMGEAVTVLVLRAHYTMDVIAGALAAWFAADMAHRLAPWADVWLKGGP